MALKVSSTMPRFTDIYTLKIEAVDKKEHIVRYGQPQCAFSA